MTYFSRIFQSDQRTYRVRDRDLGVRPVELIQRNLIEAQPAQAALTGRAQVLGAPVGLPAPRARSSVAALGSDDQVAGIGVQRLGDQVLADFRAVGVRRVDEVDPEFQSTPQCRLCSVPVRGITPDAGPGDPHSPEAEPIDGDVTADIYGAGVRRGQLAAHTDSRHVLWRP